MLERQHALVRVAAPAASPISLSEAKQHLRVEGSDSDLIIQRLIDSAVSYVDATGALGSAIINQTWGEWFSPSPGNALLSIGPFQSLVAIRYYDSDGVLQNANNANFNVFGPPTCITISPKAGFSWPATQSRDDAIKIEYVVGYGADSLSVPGSIRNALLMLVSHWYEAREAASEMKMNDVPFGFDHLIAVERGTWYG